VGRIGVEHARALSAHRDVDELVITDAAPGRADAVAAELGVKSVDGISSLLGSGVDALVVAAATGAHAGLIVAGIEAGLPVFCEKPVAGEVAGTIAVRDRVRELEALVHIGFQRRFDAGYAAARSALAAGELGELRRAHLVTCDPRPPAPEYVPVSGGIYRDMHIHDFDIVRWVTGREVVEVFANGANRGDRVFGDSGDVDESTCLLTLDDGTLVTLTVGGNDLLSAFANRPRASLLERIARDVAEAYEFLVEAIQRARPNSLILLTTIYDPSDRSGRIPGVLEDVGMLPLSVLEGMNANIARVAEGVRGTAVADVYRHFIGHGATAEPEDRWYWRRSLVEPNAMGAHEIRRVWRETLDQADADASE